MHTQHNMMEGSRIITEEHKIRFQDDGALVVKSAVSQEWVEKLREVTEWAMKQQAPTTFEHEKDANGSGRFFEDQFMWMRHDDARAFIHEGPLAAAAADIMEASKVNIFYDHLLCKEPGTTTPTPWHNDMSYWHLRGWQVCSIWLALDPVDISTCVKYWAGSHHLQKLHKVTSFAGEDTYTDCQAEPLPDVDDLHRKGDITMLHWNMQPGDILIHHGWTIHGAPGNLHSSLRRRGYVTRWTGDDVTFDARPGTIYSSWEKTGYGSDFKDGDPMESDIHPVVYRA